MGVGFSTVCSSNRSVVISNSHKAIKAPSEALTRPDNEQTSSSPKKLHACLSRDSGIVENDIFQAYQNRTDSQLTIRDDDDEDGESLEDSEEDRELSDDINACRRPRSCRLGDRSKSQSRKNRTSVVDENRLVEYIRSNRTSGPKSDVLGVLDTSSLSSEDSFYDCDINGNPSRTKSAYSRQKPKKKSEADFGCDMSDFYGDSDSDTWTIPDETGQSALIYREEETRSKKYRKTRSETNGSQRGWVVHEDTDLRSIGGQSSSSGTITPTHSSRSSHSVDYYSIRMDDLVETFLDSLQEFEATPTQDEYEAIMRNLRMELVDFVSQCNTSADGTPRIKVRSGSQSLFSNDPWTVEIQLKAADEEILKTSEKHLSERLQNKGPTITRDDIVILLGDHLRTIEQLQHVRDSGRLTKSEAQEESKRLLSAPSDRSTDSMNPKRKKVPNSAPNKPHRPGKQTKDGPKKKAKSKLRIVRGDLPGVVQSSEDQYDSSHDSDSTLENEKEPLGLPPIGRNLPAHSDRTNNPKSIQMKQIQDEVELSQSITAKIWPNRRSILPEEVAILISEARDEFIKQHGHFLSKVLAIDRPNARNRAETQRLLKRTPSTERRKEECEQELFCEDRIFFEDLQKTLVRDDITKLEVEKLIQNHMRKTSVLKVNTIQVEPAPLSRTRSLNDAIEYTRGDASAGSHTSRRSEPDMRLYNGIGTEYEDLWAGSDKRAHSARKNAPRAITSRRRSGQTQVHGLIQMEPLTEGTEEINLPRVEEIEGKMTIKSRPDSGIAVSMSSGSYSSYSSSEVAKETEDIEEVCVTDSSEMRDRVFKVNADDHTDMKSLVAAITKGLNSKQTKTHALYCWIVNQCLAKFSRTSKNKNSPSSKLRQISEKKNTYAQFFQELCKSAGIKCEKIEGFVKSKDYLPGNAVQSVKYNHTWNAVHIDGQYRLVDPAFGARKEKFFMDHYFMTSPDVMILSHFPKDKKWMLMNHALTIDGFEDTVKTWPTMFHFNIRPLNMKSVIRTYDGKLSITVLLQNVAVIPQLEYSGPGAPLDPDTLTDCIDEEIRDVESAETFHVNLPKEGNYFFTLLAHVLEDEIDVPVFQYRIQYTDELL